MSGRTPDPGGSRSAKKGPCATRPESRVRAASRVRKRALAPRVLKAGMVPSGRKVSCGCSRHARRNRGARAAPREQKWECGVLVPSAPVERLALHVCRKAWALVPHLAHSRSGGSRPTTRTWEMADTVHPEREVRVTCGVGPRALNKRALAPCSVGSKGGGASRHTCWDRAGRHALARASGAPPREPEWGFLHRLCRKRGFAPGVPRLG